MQKIDYYTGQPVIEPTVGQLIDPTDRSGDFAFNTANYNYNYQSTPMSIQQPFQQQNIPYGYQGVQQPFYGAPMNTPYNPWNQQPPMNQWQMQNARRYGGFQGGYIGNPYYGRMTQPIGMYNPYAQQAVYYQQPQDQVVHVPGYNPFGSNGMLLTNAEEICDKLQVDAMLDNEKAIAKREQHIQGYFNNNYGGYSYYNNFYGIPYYTNNYDQGVYNNLRSKLQEMANEAIQRRIDFNKNLSRMVHGYLGDNVEEEQIDKLYDGYTYTIPGASVIEYAKQDELARYVDFDNSTYYQQLDAQVSAMYHSIAPSGRNMNEFLADAGMLIMEDKLEQKYHNQRDGSRLYNTDTYHRYLRKYALENELKMKQDKVLNEVKNGNFEHLPTDRIGAAKFLFGDEVAKGLADFQQKLANGPNIPTQPIQPIGPQNQFGTPVIMTDEEEADFEMRRHAFLQSIYENSK